MNYLKKYSSILSVIALIIAFTFSANSTFAQNATTTSQDTTKSQDKSVVEIVESSENHTVFADMLNESGLSKAIEDEGPYTVVAPTDEAFESMDTNLEEIKNDQQMMNNIVSGHLFQGKVESSEVEASVDVNITEGNIDASNGYVHITDGLIKNDQ